MPRDGQRQIRRRHAAAVIGDPDQHLAAAGIVHDHPPRARIERIFHQFLHRRRRTLHHFTRGNAVDRSFVQRANHGSVIMDVGVMRRHDPTSSRMRPMGPQIR